MGYIRASQHGVDLIKQVIAKNQRTQKFNNVVIAQNAGVNPRTLDRFFKREFIQESKFIYICEHFKQDWTEIREQPQEESIQDPISASDNRKQPEGYVNPMLSSPHTEKFESYINGKLRRFSGRGHIFKEFEEYTKKYDRGYFLVLADPGEGKSSIAARYVTKNECVYYFNARRKGWTSAEVFLETICNQLIEYAGLESEYASDNANKTALLLLKLLNIISGQLEQSKKLIVVIDALDEVSINSQEEGSTILYLPDTVELPRNVFFLLTSRRDKEIKLPFGIPEDGIIDLKNRKDRCNEDIKEYLENTFNDKQDGEQLRIWLDKFYYQKQNFENEIIENSQRNFMYLTLVLSEIIKGNYKNIKPEKLPKGLAEYYDDHFDRMIKLLQQNGWSLDSLRIVYVICEYEGISIPFQELVEQTRLKSEQIIWVLEHWNQFLDADAIEEELYNFYHESYVDHLRKEKTVMTARIDLKEVNKYLVDNMMGDFRFG